MHAGHLQLGTPDQILRTLRKPNFAIDRSQSPLVAVLREIRAEGEHTALGDRHVTRQLVLPVEYLNPVTPEDSRFRLSIVLHVGITIEVVFAEVENDRGFCI